MRISDLIRLGQRYLTLGIVAALVVAIAFLAGYFILYRKILKGQKKLNLTRFLWWAVFLSYLTVILGVTLMERGGFWQNGKIQPLFYSYRDAWADFSAASWRNIILNICMFIPFGFLLPLGFHFFRKFWKTYLAGFVLTAIIEFTQLFLSRGVFELDDLLHNTVGTMIGYGVFALFSAVAVHAKKSAKEDILPGKKKRIAFPGIFALQLPLIITIVTFSTIFITYGQQELGNDNYQYVIKYDSDQVQVTTNEDYSKENGTLPVYKVPTLSKDETIEFAAHLFQELGTDIDESRNDFYENTAVFWAFDRYSLWIDYAGGSYSLTDFDITFPEEEEGQESVNMVTDASEKEIRKALLKYDVEIPKEAEFDILESGNYQFHADQLSEGNTITDGYLTCDYYDNGCCANIDNKIVTCDFYKDFSTISEQEAYEKICAGEFRYAESGKLNIEAGVCRIVYDMDSKGFYQPIYLFSCNINGEEAEIGIPAIK